MLFNTQIYILNDVYSCFNTFILNTEMAQVEKWLNIPLLFLFSLQGDPGVSGFPGTDGRPGSPGLPGLNDVSRPVM